MLKLVGSSKLHLDGISAGDLSALEDHASLLEGFFQSYRIRNFQERTIIHRRNFLSGWFQLHGTKVRPLLTWQAMAPIQGRKRIVDYGNALMKTDISSSTIRTYLGILRSYFSYVLEHPFIFKKGQHYRIQDRYGPIDQPISEYDIPVHVRDGESLGIPLEPERLYDFYAILRKYYLTQGHSRSRARNYAMLVLAGESGLRADELLHLEVNDLFFDSHKVQTRFAKATYGSGKRSRLTLFPPLARDTLRFYLNSHRALHPRAKDSGTLFLSKTGTFLSYSTVQQGLQEMVSCAQHVDFPVGSHLGWHDMRRIFATRFIEKFQNQLPVLIHLLGHSGPNTVHKYIRHSEAWMNKQIQSVLEGDGKAWPSIGD